MATISSARLGTMGAALIRASVVASVLAFVKMRLNAKPIMMPNATL